MSKAQLEALYTKIGANNPNLQYNGPFLHLQQTVGGFYEWTVLTYNMQVIAKYIKENSDLRKKYEELLKVYNGGKKPAQQQQQVSGGASSYSGEHNLNAVISMILQRIEELEKRYNNISPASAAPPPNIYTPSWNTGYRLP